MPLNVSFVRPEVVENAPTWNRIDDCIAGEKAIKAKGETYLPRPNGDKSEAGDTRYDSYKARASFYNATGKTVEGLTGQVFAKETEIDLPGELEIYEEDIDGAGTPLEQQAKIVLHNTIAKGHGGLLADFPVNDTDTPITKAQLENGEIRPRVIFIHPQNIINWRQKRVNGNSVFTLLVIKEEKIIENDDEFSFTTEPQWREYRILETGGKVSTVVRVWAYANQDKQETQALDPAKKQEIALGKNLKPAKDVQKSPSVIEGPYTIHDFEGNPIDYIPFTFVGSTNNEACIDKAPMIDIADLNIAHYRNSADLEESSFVTGQPTMTIAGMTSEWMTEFYPNGILFGSRTAVVLPENAQVDMKQAEPNNLPKELMTDKEERMRALGAKLVEQDATKGTATEALIEESSESSVLASAAKNVSAAFRKILGYMGAFVGKISPDQITFELNSDFDIARMTAQERAQLIAEWQGGLITWEEARTALRATGIAFEDDDKAQEKIDQTMLPGFEDDPAASSGTGSQ